jgi:ribosomal protein S18 acetylase RimI-like enzyme
MRIVQIGPSDTEWQRALGEITVESYRPLLPAIDDDGYAEELADVAARVAGAVVLAALDEAGEVLGGITYVPDGSSALAEWKEDAAGVRMLAVRDDARGRGVGDALVRACLDRARAAGIPVLVLHSTPSMQAAHRLYQRLGFVRDDTIDDWIEDLHLMGFRLQLR